MRRRFHPTATGLRINGEAKSRTTLDIYVKEVDGAGFNRLTTGPADDCCPAWSPDGRQIAFLRSSGDRQLLYLISPLGGGEKKLAEVGSGPLSWSPDGKTIAFADTSIWTLSVETQEKMRLTSPPAARGTISRRTHPMGSILRSSGGSGSKPGFMSCACRMANRSLLRTSTIPCGHAGPPTVGKYCFPHTTRQGRSIVADFDVWWRASKSPARGERVSYPAVSRNRLVYENATGQLRHLEDGTDRKGGCRTAIQSHCSRGPQMRFNCYFTGREQNCIRICQFRKHGDLGLQE